MGVGIFDSNVRCNTVGGDAQSYYYEDNGTKNYVPDPETRNYVTIPSLNDTSYLIEEMPYLVIAGQVRPLKVTTFLAEIITDSPVFGFLPGRATFFLTTKLPKPEILTSSPLASEPLIVSKKSLIIDNA